MLRNDDDVVSDSNDVVDDVSDVIDDGDDVVDDVSDVIDDGDDVATLMMSSVMMMMLQR